MKNRIASLDFLRGIAISLVIFNHCNSETISHFPQKFPSDFGNLYNIIYWRIHQFGWSGVELFFVLSGFLISGILFKEIQETGRIKYVRFWIRRGFKIWPSYIFLLLIIGITNTTQYLNYDSGLKFFKSLFIHLFFFQNYFENANGPTWSLAIEEHFYTLLPIILILLIKFKGNKNKTFFQTKLLPKVFYVILFGCLFLRVFHSTISPLGLNENSLSRGILINSFMETQFRFDALFFGVFLQYLHFIKSPIISYILKRRFIFLILSFALIIPATFWGRNSYIMFNFGFLSLSIGYSLIVTLFYGNSFKIIERNFIYRTLTYIGLYSYNIYLWHWILPLMNVFYLNDFLYFLSIKISSPVLSGLVQCIVFALSSIFVGFILTKLMEEPFLKIRNKFFSSKFKIEKLD
jgi:peptidoglycan/LPS O-acetylase OafA/YrhL